MCAGSRWRECCRHDTTGKTPGRLSQTPCPAPPAKIFLFPKIRNYDLRRTSRAHGGRVAIVTNVGCGMRWTRCYRRRAMSMRTVKPCGPVPSTLGSSCAMRFAQRRWLTSPRHRGERGAAVQTIAQGVPDRFGEPVVTMLVCFFHSAYEAAGAQSARHSLRPLFSKGDVGSKARTQIALREC